MRKIKLYIAISIDGKIAKENGDVKWLEEIPNPDKSDYGYREFVESIDTTLMGNSTYKQIISFGIDFPYADKINYVFTRNSSIPDNENVKFISRDVIEFTQKLKNEDGRDIWLIGGSELNTLLFNNNLVDELIIFVMPIVIGAGIPLFSKFTNQKMLNLVESQNFSNGVVMLKYNFI